MKGEEGVPCEGGGGCTPGKGEEGDVRTLSAPYRGGRGCEDPQ